LYTIDIGGRHCYRGVFFSGWWGKKGKGWDFYVSASMLLIVEPWQYKYVFVSGRSVYDDEALASSSSLVSSIDMLRVCDVVEAVWLISALHLLILVLGWVENYGSPKA